MQPSATALHVGRWRVPLAVDRRLLTALSAGVLVTTASWTEPLVPGVLSGARVMMTFVLVAVIIGAAVALITGRPTNPGCSRRRDGR